MPLTGQTADSIVRDRAEERRMTSGLERAIGLADAVLIALTVAAIAYGDWLVGLEVSLGYLYLIPLSLCALTQDRRLTIALLLVCMGLRQWLSPLELSPQAYLIRDFALTGIFLSLVAAMMRFRERRLGFFEQARHQRDELLEELRLAAEVQGNILQRNQPPDVGWDIVAKMDPARVVGGDYYDFLQHQDGTLGIIIADVAGKGLPAAMLMPAVDTTLRALSERTSDSAQTLAELNQVLQETTGAASYATVFYAALDTQSGRLQYSNGGHLPALVLRASGAGDWLLEGGTPVGILPGSQYELAETRMEAGDVLVLYTDGIVEQQDADGEQFGEDRLLAVVSEARNLDAGGIVDAIRTAVYEFGATAERSDDATAIVVKAPA